MSKNLPDFVTIKELREMSTIERASHIMYCQDMVSAAINNWMRVMECPRLEAAERVLLDAETMTNSMDEPKIDPDLVEAAREAVKKARRGKP